MITFLELGKLGRFGNALFQVASTIGQATKHGYSFAFPPLINHDHKNRFGSTEDIELWKHFLHPLPLIPEGYTCPEYRIPWGYHSQPVPDNVSLWGHMQSPKYFEHCIDLVRYYLTMKDEPPQLPFCAIHIRLGDYDNAYHPRLTSDYYQKAMAQFPPDTPFVVFSDDVEGADKIIGFGGKVIYGGNRNYLDDFKMMKRCKDFICGNSSYSLMAACLGDHPEKKIVAPLNWFGTSWGSGYREMSRDMYPAGSIVI